MSHNSELSNRKFPRFPEAQDAFQEISWESKDYLNFYVCCLEINIFKKEEYRNKDKREKMPAFTLKISDVKVHLKQQGRNVDYSKRKSEEKKKDRILDQKHEFITL